MRILTLKMTTDRHKTKEMICKFNNRFKTLNYHTSYKSEGTQIKKVINASVP